MTKELTAKQMTERRLARLSEKQAQATEDAALDAPILAEIDKVIREQLEPTMGTLYGLADQLIETVTTDGVPLGLHVSNLKIVQKNLSNIIETLVKDAADKLAPKAEG